VQYDVEINGRTRQVVVVRTDAGLTVTVDGRAWQVDAARVDAHTLSLLIADPAAEGDEGAREASHEVTIAPDAASSQLAVRVGTLPILVGVNGSRRWGGRHDESVGGSGPQRLTAPMPGKVVRVLVKAGDAVHLRQPLVVVEAMKMENEIRAGRDGTVGEVHAREGASVEAGTLLVVIQ